MEQKLSSDDLVLISTSIRAYIVHLNEVLRIVEDQELKETYTRNIEDLKTLREKIRKMY